MKTKTPQSIKEFDIDLSVMDPDSEYYRSIPDFADYSRRWSSAHSKLYTLEMAVAELLPGQDFPGTGRQYYEQVIDALQRKIGHKISVIGEGMNTNVYFTNPSGKIPVSESLYFSYFFIFKLSKLEPAQIDHFLSYHLVTSFENNLDEFSKFLTISIEGYKKKCHLAEGYCNICTRWIEQSKMSSPQYEIEEKVHHKNFTFKRQLLAMYYIFADLEVSEEVSSIKKARFLQFLLRRDYDETRKRIDKPLENYPSDQARNDDLKFIRGYFIELKMVKIVEMIDEELKL
jgi:hypothetical protein